MVAQSYVAESDTYFSVTLRPITPQAWHTVGLGVDATARTCQCLIDGEVFPTAPFPIPAEATGTYSPDLITTAPGGVSQFGTYTASFDNFLPESQIAPFSPDGRLRNRNLSESRRSWLCTRCTQARTPADRPPHRIVSEADYGR